MKTLKWLIAVQIISISLCGIAFADPGKVILLLGTSTAGKTTLIDELKKHHPDVVDYGIDIAMNSEFQKLIKENAPDDYRTLAEYAPPEKIPALVWGEKIWLKGGLSEQQTTEINGAINRIQTQAKSFPINWGEVLDRIYDHIFEEARNGKTVLMDLVDSKSFEAFSAKKGDVPVSTFLTYCSLEELSRRMTKRNQDAEASGRVGNKRIGFPLMQFSQLYKKRTNDEEPLLGLLRRESIDEAFQLHYPNDPSKKLEFLKAFGFLSPEINEIEITTRFELGDAHIVNTANPTSDLVSLIEHETSQAEKQFLETYKALHLGGKDTPEAKMIKRAIKTDMGAAIRRYIDQAQKNCGPAIEPAVL